MIQIKFNYVNFSGQYLGAAHSKCNMERQTDKHIPILFHNFKVSSKILKVFKGISCD